MPRAHQYSAWFLYALICGVYLALFFGAPAAYVRLTYEDLYGEWLQTWLFAAVWILATPLIWRDRAYGWFFALLSLAAFYTLMEEISWGQRLLAIESPEFFAENNGQGETNLHNFLTGPDSTLLKDVVEYTLASALIAYGVLFPLLLRGGWSGARWLSASGLAPPPLYLWMFFVNAAFFEIGWYKVNEAEVAEILVGTALLLMVLYYLIVAVPIVQDEVAKAGANEGGAHAARARSVRCARLSLSMFAVLVALAWGTTTLYYNMPGRAAAIDARLANGYDKFAARMRDEGRWYAAAELYRAGFELGPENLPMLHKALDYYRAAGDTASYDKYFRVMLAATAAEVATDNPSVEILLMLATNYASIGEQTTAAEYADRALAAAIEMIAATPDSSDGYYWLGRSLQQRGEYSEAGLAYQQALTIEPDRSRNILALRSLQIEVDKAAE
jgi:tetratricopeptide (TPR) repeat protein